MSSNGRQPGLTGDKGDSASALKLTSAGDPVKLQCKNTFFEIPDVGDSSGYALGPATCPLPTEGWWSSPTPSQGSGRPEVSPNPNFQPTPDWSPTPNMPPDMPPGNLAVTSGAPSVGRFDRMLVEATAEDDVSDEEEQKERRPSLHWIDVSSGETGGLQTPWEDTPTFPPQRRISNKDGNTTRQPPDVPPPAKPSSRFELMLQQANESDEGRRSSVASSFPKTPETCGMPDTPWGAGGLESPWEEPAPFAAPHGFAAAYRPPLLATGPSASAYAPHVVGEPARLPLSSLGEPMPTTGPLLSVPPPVPTAPVGPPAGGRVRVDLAGALFGGPSLPASQNNSPEKTKARRRRGSKEAKNPDHNKDDKWWLPTSTYIDLGGLVKVPKESSVPVPIAA